MIRYAVRDIDILLFNSTAILLFVEGENKNIFFCFFVIILSNSASLICLLGLQIF